MAAAINKKHVFVVTVLLLLAVGVLVLADQFQYRRKVEIAEKNADLDKARLSISSMGMLYGARREGFTCRSNARLRLHVVQVQCGGNGEIFIEYPLANGNPAEVRYSASPKMVYLVDGIARNGIRIKLSLDQMASIQRLVNPAALNLNPLEPPDTEYAMPSFPLGMEGCIDGRYFAAERGSGEMEPAFEAIWMGMHKTLNASLELSPDAPPVMCL